MDRISSTSLRRRSTWGSTPGRDTTVFAEELKDFNVSKGAMRIPWDRNLPVELIQRIAEWCYEVYHK